jgi:hypothetical protein
MPAQIRAGPNRGSGAYCIEGTVTFEDLATLRADETPQPWQEFAADGDRYWQALYSGDPRLSVAAQRAAQDRTPSWRPYIRDAVMVNGSLQPPSE